MDQAEPDEGPGPCPPRPQSNETGTGNHHECDADERSGVWSPEADAAPRAEGTDGTEGKEGSEDGEGGEEESLMAALEDLPAPDAESPESLIGSTAATRDAVTAETHDDARVQSHRVDIEMGSSAADTEQAGGQTDQGPDRLGGGGSEAEADTSGSTLRWASLDELDELTIVARAQDGDSQAFDWLISAYQGGVYRLCFRMLNDRSDAEDVVQETFIAAWRSLPKLTVPQAFIPWLYRTATNKCLDDLRRRQRRPTDPTADIDEHGQAAGSASGPALTSGRRDTIGASQPLDPSQEFENQAQMRALADLLQTVPPGLRVCWLLREIHEFSYAEIAAIVQLPQSTVRGRIARAKRFLAEGMEPWR